MMLDQRLETADRQLYKLHYFSRVHPDESNINVVAWFDCKIHVFAVDATEALTALHDNTPEGYPVSLLVAVLPVSPDVPADSMIEVGSIEAGPLGPREIEH